MLLCFGATLYILHSRAETGARPEEPSKGATIESVVEASRPQISDCWNRALLTRARDASREVHVDATIVIASSGAIDRVTTTGDPEGYPGLASCIEAKIRKWHFPQRPQPTCGASVCHGLSLALC